jgi:hypothetical protein
MSRSPQELDRQRSIGNRDGRRWINVNTLAIEVNYEPPRDVVGGSNFDQSIFSPEPTVSLKKSDSIKLRHHFDCGPKRLLQLQVSIENLQFMQTGRFVYLITVIGCAGRGQAIISDMIA